MLVVIEFNQLLFILFTLDLIFQLILLYHWLDTCMINCMRFLLFTAVLFLSLFQAELAYAQQGSEEVSAAFEQKDSEAIATFFRDHVQLSICTKNGVFSQTQAERILEDFFRKHPNAVFAMDHVGRTEKSGNYCVGTYSEDGNNYRVTYLLQAKSDAAIIRNLSISEIKKG